MSYSKNECTRPVWRKSKICQRKLLKDLTIWRDLLYSRNEITTLYINGEFS